MNKVELSTRQATDSDFEFCWNVYSDSVSATMSQLIAGGWKPEIEKKRFGSIWAPSDSHLVLYDSLPVGWLAFREHGDQLAIDHLYLRKSHQKKGIGTILVDFLAGKATAGKRRLTAEVLKSCTAVSFCEKMRFSPVGQTGIAIQVHRLAQIITWSHLQRKKSAMPQTAQAKQAPYPDERASEVDNIDPKETFLL